MKCVTFIIGTKCSDCLPSSYEYMFVTKNRITFFITWIVVYGFIYRLCFKFELDQYLDVAITALRRYYDYYSNALSHRML